MDPIGPSVYKTRAYRAPFNLKQCAASVYHAIGIGGDFSQCGKPGKFKINGHVWCAQHAKKFPLALVPEELKQKREEGARWWPGQTIYRVNIKFGAFELHEGKVVRVQKTRLEVERDEVSDYLTVAPFDFVFPTKEEAYADAAKKLEAEVKNLERDLKERQGHLALARIRALKESK